MLLLMPARSFYSEWHGMVSPLDKNYVRNTHCYVQNSRILTVDSRLAEGYVADVHKQLTTCRPSYSLHRIENGGFVRFVWNYYEKTAERLLSCQGHIVGTGDSTWASLEGGQWNVHHQIVGGELQFKRPAHSSCSNAVK